TPGVRRNGARARALDRRAAGRFRRGGRRRADRAPGRTQAPGRGQDRGGEGKMIGAGFRPRHFLWETRGEVALITLNRPERKNPLTFDSYAELRDTFRALADAADVKAVVLRGAG